MKVGTHEFLVSRFRAAWRERLDQVMAKLDQLDPFERFCVYGVISGHSLPEISGSTGAPVASAWNTLRVAALKLD